MAEIMTCVDRSERKIFFQDLPPHWATCSPDYAEGFRWKRTREPHDAAKLHTPGKAQVLHNGDLRRLREGHRAGAIHASRWQRRLVLTGMPRRSSARSDPQRWAPAKVSDCPSKTGRRARLL